MTDKQAFPRDSVAVTLDDAALARLRELDPDGRHGVLARVLAAFDTSLTRMLAQLEAQLHQPDGDVVRSIAHTLKSSSASVGAMDLAQACSEVERALRDGSCSDVAADVRRLIHEAQRAQQAVGAMLRA